MKALYAILLTTLLPLLSWVNPSDDPHTKAMDAFLD